MKVEKVLVEGLIADPANLRKHDAKNLKAIEASLRRFGQQKPIVVDGDGIVRAGNGTLAAAKQLGWTHINVVRTQLSGVEATAYAIADNRTAELAEWDDAALSRILSELNEGDHSIVDELGFDIGSISSLSDPADGPQVLENAETVVPFAPKGVYVDQVIRQIVLVFSASEYASVIEAFNKYAADKSLPNNTEVVLHMLEERGYEISRA